MCDTLLKAEDVCYTYEGDDRPALNHLSLEVRRGQKIACMGSNGSGKSTFFLCCNGIHKPDAGVISYHGKPMDYSKKGLLHLRSKVGIVFQDPDHQLFSASVLQEISFGVLNLGFSETAARQKVNSVMDLLGITPFSHKPAHALSGGQKKLVAIADILVMEPELIIFDEPAASLDPLHTRIVRDIIDRIAAQGITVMMATHDVDYAYGWADDILLFHEGQVTSHGSPKTVFSNPKLMETVSLRPPSTLSLFQNLCESGILPDTLPFPENPEVLADYIKAYTIPKIQ